MRLFDFVAVPAVLLFAGGSSAELQNGQTPSGVFPLQYCQNDTCYDLKHVAVVHRHTIRAPESFPQNDLYLREEYYPRKTGRATTQGLERALVLGNILRHWLRESGFLSGDVNEVYARTSSIPRCFETSLEILKGIFLPGPCSGEECIDFDPVAIFRVPKIHDKNINFCAHQEIPEEMLTVPIPDELKGDCKTLSDYTEYVKETIKAGNISANELFLQYVDSFICNDWEKLPLPSFIDENRPLWDWASEKYYRNFMYTFGTSPGRGVSADIIGLLREATQQTTNAVARKLSVLGYHDTTVTSLLDSMTTDLETPLPRPNFIGALFFELLQNDDGFIVRVRRSQGLMYDGGYSHLVDVPISDCDGNICTIEELASVFEAYFKTEECPSKYALI